VIQLRSEELDSNEELGSIMLACWPVLQDDVFLLRTPACSDCSWHAHGLRRAAQPSRFYGAASVEGWQPLTQWLDDTLGLDFSSPPAGNRAK
jgi:hypothetical protein